MDEVIDLNAPNSVGTLVFSVFKCALCVRPSSIKAPRNLIDLEGLIISPSRLIEAFTAFLFLVKWMSSDLSGLNRDP